ncbi:carboxynorspermidine decarboxylase [Halomonas sp. McH1-25]|uniref:carboxynorspermidine decarboxylase n=1 Tax=unclassified Halomonas TaxID=2609666 RepID=UPI001EF42968|nr:MULTISPECIES: carboxynorspermidine decarboxylase [unclassified Halomonas]MCG7598781.1 carboxynorspermidine decarboxylase [Halomonas sp. McH1-25]MCP1340744.1 carboxynorspermidine decarboxylase [Halomonas sp. FL8]MCP1359515.1 carboxynorspermidine decarboxylase [Halomonas sp. BBD45]MCP1363865.1 carboxynorspermidine decarboxylase [Halomonas sp. BBD48]
MAETTYPFDIHACPSPAYVVDDALLRRNLERLKEAQERSGAKILLALKGFAMWDTFPLVSQYLVGTTSSGQDEARLGAETFGGEVHVYSPAFTDPEMDVVLHYADHISFNSPGQWRHFRDKVAAAPRPISCGLRVNPEHSTGEVAIYDPCARGSRLGTRSVDVNPDVMNGLDGLHFHTLCEQNSDALEATLEVFEAKFGEYLPNLRWVNFGGGHHITRADYDMDRLVRVIRDFKAHYPHLEVYLEPGEAIALNTGYLVCSVLDIVDNDGPIAILDTSATAHMPDVLEMPYRPEIIGAGMPDEKAYTYRLGGTTCLAGDVIGDYSFDRPLEIGDRLVFTDMAHYTMVKTTTFNGIRLPAICRIDETSREVRTVKAFGYLDYMQRLS